MEQTLQKRLKSAGSSIEIIGLFLFLYNLVFIFLISKAFLIPMLITAALGLAFLAFGWQIRKGNSPTSKKMLQASMVLSLVLIALSVVVGQRGGMAFYLLIAVFVGSYSGLDSIKKLNNPSLQAAEAKAENLKGPARAKDILKMVLIAIVVLAIFLGLSFIGYKMK